MGQKVATKTVSDFKIRFLRQMEVDQVFSKLNKIGIREHLGNDNA